jgi:hypothetical protein
LEIFNEGCVLVASYLILQFLNPQIEQRDEISFGLIGVCGLSVLVNVLTVIYATIADIYSLIKELWTTYKDNQEIKRRLENRQYFAENLPMLYGKFDKVKEEF